jgi:two-component system response regulator FlrC
VKPFEYGPLITVDPVLNRIMQTATNVAASKATVLISGESGTGKELLAKYIHQKSQRSSSHFVAINCAALPEGLLESELFGYERGAFTGAISQKIGKFEHASHSTILLDEISEMSLPLQAKLLRVLQEEEVDRLGGKYPVKVNLRVIATTNRDLRSMVKEGKFREDLYYRLNVIPLHIPSLRQRPGDVVLLASHFAQVSAILNQKLARPLNIRALDKIKQWSWPGNVRELENVIERAVLLAEGTEIALENILIEEDENFKGGASATSHPGLNLTQGLTIAEMERLLIFKTLDQTSQNRTRAAKILGISIRTLRNKLHEYQEVKCG